VFLGGQPRHCVCTNVSRGLSQRTTKFHLVTCGGGACFYAVSHVKGAGSQRSPVFGVPFYLMRRSLQPLSQNYHIWRGNTRGRGACILGSATPSVPRDRSSNFLHHLTQNNQIRQDIIHIGRGVFLGGQPRHCICTNASRAARFVSDSWVSCMIDQPLLKVSLCVIRMLCCFKSCTVFVQAVCLL